MNALPRAHTCTHCPNAPAVRLDETPGKVQADAEAALGACRTCLSRLRAELEDRIDLVRVFGCVADQVLQRLGQLHHIGVEKHRLVTAADAARRW